MSIRVLHCRTETGRNAWTLAQAEKRLGLHSTVMVYGTSWLNYPSDVDLCLADRGALSKTIAVGRAVMEAAREYDVIHFNGGRSFMPSSPRFGTLLNGVDLAYLRRKGKAIVVTFQGCDVRQCRSSEAYYRGDNACVGDQACAQPCSRRTDAFKQDIVSEFDRHAQHIFALNPDLLTVLPSRAEFLPYTTIEPTEWAQLETARDYTGGPFRILHAPTKRGVKGTQLLIDAIDRLRVRFPQVELVLVENVPHDQVQELYASAHLAVDQLLLGWYGGFAVEAMALGLPVVCYIRERDLDYIPNEMRQALPLIRANRMDIEAVLEGILRDPSSLRSVRKRSSEYVAYWHDPDRVARHVRTVYEAALEAVGRQG